MNLRNSSLLGITTCLALFFAASTTVVPVAAQEGSSNAPSSAISSDLSDNDHNRGPQNGDLAVSATIVVDGAYGPAEIATLPKDGGPYNYLTTAAQMPDGALDPVFTPDGRRIFFWALGSPDFIYSVPAGGGPITEVHTNCIDDPNCFGDDNPAVSPDGRELLALRSINSTDPNVCFFFGIYRFRIDGSHPKQLSPSGPPPCTGDGEPRWSPDGNWIVFQHGDPNGVTTIWIMRRDGSHRRQVTAAITDVGNPDWSPDGQRIVFQSPSDPADDQHPQQIYTIHPDGTHLRQITHEIPIPGATIANFGVRWSPDGRKIVFAHRDPTSTQGPDGLPHSDLWEINSDGNDAVQITFTPEKDNGPAWGPRRW